MATPTSYNISFKATISESGLTNVALPQEILDASSTITTSTSSTLTYKEIKNLLPYTSVIYENSYIWYLSDYIKLKQLGNEVVYTLKWYCLTYSEQSSLDSDVLFICDNFSSIEKYMKDNKTYIVNYKAYTTSESGEYAPGSISEFELQLQNAMPSDLYMKINSAENYPYFYLNGAQLPILNIISPSTPSASTSVDYTDGGKSYTATFKSYDDYYSILDSNITRRGKWDVKYSS